MCPSPAVGSPAMEVGMTRLSSDASAALGSWRFSGGVRQPFGVAAPCFSSPGRARWPVDLVSQNVCECGSRFAAFGLRPSGCGGLHTFQNR